MNYYKTESNQIYAYDDNQMEWVAANNKIKELKLTAITEAEALALSNPPPSKAERTERALAELKREKEALLDKLTVTYNGVDYDANERSQIRINGAITLLSLAPEGTTQDWVSASDETHALTSRDLIALGAAIAAKLSEITFDYAARKAALIAEIEEEYNDE